jgi:hypothetical protein
VIDQIGDTRVSMSARLINPFTGLWEMPQAWWVHNRRSALWIHVVFPQPTDLVIGVRRSEAGEVQDHGPGQRLAAAAQWLARLHAFLGPG